VRDLEENYDEEDKEGETESEESKPHHERGEGRGRFEEEGELPSAELIIQELEKHLNLRRNDDDNPSRNG
jgi:hypothetical protein